MEIVTYLLTGATAGLMAGLLGVGGGLVIVPALAILFVHQGFATDTVMHYAVGTSLATIIPTSISSLLAHQRRSSVHWPVVRAMVPGILPGALASAWLAKQFSSAGLALVFGVFVMLVAVQLLIGLKPSPHRQLPGVTGLSVTGSVIGLVSGLLGIGGGSLTVPFLLWNRVDIRLAVGTAATLGLPIAIAGTLGFIFSGLDVPAQPGYNSGFIYWPAVAAVVLASVPAAPLGARLAHYLPRVTLQRVFALLLAIIGVKMMLGA
ncbi:MAG: sulfite exporter TauE/SafE family protein [Pseudomonadota bacterium]